MNKMILFASIALVVGLGAGTTVGVMTAPPPSRVSATAKPDSSSVAVASHGGAPGGAAINAVPASSGPSPIVPATSPAPAPVTPAAAPASAAAPPTAGAAPGAGPAPPAGTTAGVRPAITPAEAQQLSYKQVARILSNMNPQDAVKILAYLQDEHVQGILQELGVRQAASLLSQLPTERAARLSERIMHHPVETK